MSPAPREVARDLPGARNIRLLIEYDGEGLCGWQRQRELPTVQGHLEKALSTVCRQPIVLRGASRTDAGVHARGQVANFFTTSQVDCFRLPRSLNALVPANIAVREVQEAPRDFDARFSSRGKRYRYRILHRQQRPALARGRVWWRSGPLDPALMERAAADFVGRHDFAAFRAADCGSHEPVKDIWQVRIESRGELIEVVVEGRSFLKQMVRIMCGTLVEIGAGKRPPDSIPALIAGRDRKQAGRTAPAAGLLLDEVFYPS